MSRARKQLRDVLHNGEKMGLDLSSAIAEVEKEKIHEFPMQDQQGNVGLVKIPHSKMKRCFCGCDRFNLQFHVTWARPSGVLGAQTMCLQVAVYVCAECGKQLTPANPTVGDPMLAQ